MREIKLKHIKNFLIYANNIILEYILLIVFNELTTQYNLPNPFKFIYWQDIKKKEFRFYKKNISFEDFEPLKYLQS